VATDSKNNIEPPHPWNPSIILGGFYCCDRQSEGSNLLVFLWRKGTLYVQVQVGRIVSGGESLQQRRTVWGVQGGRRKPQAARPAAATAEMVKEKVAIVKKSRQSRQKSPKLPKVAKSEKKSPK
jgi:hypothetical protein